MKEDIKNKIEDATSSVDYKSIEKMTKNELTEYFLGDSSYGLQEREFFCNNREEYNYWMDLFRRKGFGAIIEEEYSRIFPVIISCVPSRLNSNMLIDGDYIRTSARKDGESEYAEITPFITKYIPGEDNYIGIYKISSVSSHIIMPSKEINNVADIVLGNTKDEYKRKLELS